MKKRIAAITLTVLLVLGFSFTVYGTKDGDEPWLNATRIEIEVEILENECDG
ncbi:MAG: hypothetical protein FWE44_06275 [Defluviitaleaceae bacterium]|nr:hypothetical protein [Defluviitaleaceae bacterium]